ncbi:TIR domain-containing protein [Streptomyces sp. 3213]|uniref:toll/interleukin-1 receptor domain-containing protein n=1 Tax=Streptomyces sp. 3213.3 TaxID=1855348 RepID=UPI0008966CE9|nr:toll/interleukin-1 receptor domain-containing protein [Streptomyces sp. 3213.3]SEC98992.1 TIR domain-containing protein [Streptomyces sp. 3213] [Streptomyces sp. 3213.3]
MPEIFINYRTHDGEHAATNLDNALRHRFGNEHVYRASRSIVPGDKFDDDLIHNVRGSSVLLALMGDRWLGHPRLGTEDDWVTKEILEAYRCDGRVIPVLVGRCTERPARNALPTALMWLADCQTLRYDHQNDEYDLKRIGDSLAALVPALATADRTTTEPEPPAPTPPAGGDTYSTDVGSNRGRIHIGPAHKVRQSGAGANYTAGNQQGNVSHTFGPIPPSQDDER